MSRKNVIIVAGGKGTRMKSDIPKQFLMLGNKPVLMHTIENFYISDPQINILVVIPSAYHQYWEELCSSLKFEIPHQLIAGGEERFYSVKNGLDQVPENGLVAIHDGVRPLASPALINRCFETAAKHGSAIPVTGVSESLRQITSMHSIPVDRSQYRLVQTPQVFDTRLIKKGYSLPYHHAFTDDATVFEAAIGPVTLTEGEKSNIKITCPEDLVIAEALIKNQKKNRH